MRYFDMRMKVVEVGKSAFIYVYTDTLPTYKVDKSDFNGILFIGREKLLVRRNAEKGERY